MKTLSSVLFVGAHPDDETVMAGGLLAMLRTHGVPVHAVCATDGRGGEHGGVPGADTPEGLARIREAELRCAVAALGLTSLTLLGYQDPGVGPGEQLYPFAADPDLLAAQIADVARSTGASVILTHGSDGEYGHPAHVQVHQAVLAAVHTHILPVLVYSIAARVPGIEDRLWNVHDPAHLALDITPWLALKLAAMLCHRTQHPLFKRRRQLKTVREAIRLIEAVHRHEPPLPPGGMPDDPFSALLCSVGAWRPQPAD